MAKQLVGPIERHLEKGVLGLVGLGLLGAIAMYLATSPNKIDIDGEMVGPGQIAEKIHDKAEVVRGRIKNAKPDADDFEPLFQEFAAQIDSIQRAQIPLKSPMAVKPSPPVPVIDRASKTTQDRQLVEVVKIGKPVVASGRSEFVVDPEDPTRTVPGNWATVSASFDIRAQREKQQLEYGPKRSEVVFAPLQVQRRMMHADGSWSDDDWEFVESWPAEQIPPVPEVKLVREEGQLVANKEVFKNVQKFFEKLRDPAVQIFVVRPLMAEIQFGDRWTVPVVTSQTDVLYQDAEYLYPNGDGPDPPDNRYGSSEPQAVADPNATKQDQAGPAFLIKEAEEFLAAARKSCNMQDATKAYNRALSAQNHNEARRGDKARATNLMRESENLMADIRRGLCIPQGDVKTVRGGGKLKEKLPVQQLWAHDAAPGSVRSGRTYQYRVRPVIFNRLAAQPQLFGDDPELAKTVLLEGQWSEPADPVTFQPDIFHYVVGSDEQDNEVSIELYRWFEGVWVKTRTPFAFGEKVFTRKRHEVPRNDPESIEKPRIPFDAGLVVVDIDHRRNHRARKRGGRGSAAFEPPSQECCVIFMDAEGRLHERYVSTDKNNPGKTVNSARVFKKTVGTK